MHLPHESLLLVPTHASNAAVDKLKGHRANKVLYEFHVSVVEVFIVITYSAELLFLDRSALLEYVAIPSCPLRSDVAFESPLILRICPDGRLVKVFYIVRSSVVLIGQGVHGIEGTGEGL